MVKMSLAKKITFIIALIVGFNTLNAQQYFPEKPKEFDIKFLKGKRVYVPIVDKLPKALQEEDVFKGFKLDREIDEEYAKRWKEGYKNSYFDLVDHQVIRFNKDVLKKEKEKSAIILDFEKDFYENWNAYLIVCEPKYEIIASAPVNGLKLTNVDDISLLFNMLHYSMINACNYYGDEAKPFYKGHDNKYKVAMDEFSDDLKKKTLLVPKYGSKDMKNYKKINDKIEVFLKEEWTMTPFEILKIPDLAKKLEDKNFDGFYLREFDIKTDNPKIVIKYFMVLQANTQLVLFDVKGHRELRHGNLKYLQPKLEEWLYYFMSQKKRKAFDMAKQKEEMKAQQKTPPSKKKSSKTTEAKATQKNEPVKKATGRATKSKK